jgi:transposase
MSISFDQIIALDLGKFNTVSCQRQVGTTEHRFDRLVTSPQTFHDWLAKHSGDDPSRTLLVFETCDIAGWVHDLATALGFAVAVANTAHEAWKWKRVKRKTDKDDALKMVKLATNDELPTVHMPSPQQRQKRRLMHHRRTLVERRTQIKNAIRAIFNQQGLSLPRGTGLWRAEGLALLRAEARPISDCSIDDLWRGRLDVELQLLDALNPQIAALEKKLEELADDRVKLLCTVNGVGPRLAEAVVWHLDDPKRFKNAAHVSSYAGLVPKLIESGERSRVGRITRKGPSLLRGLLVEVAWMVYRHNEWARQFVQRVSRGMKGRKKIAIVALARRLLVKLWAMLRDNRPWQEPGSERETKGQFMGSFLWRQPGRSPIAPWPAAVGAPPRRRVPLRKTPIRKPLSSDEMKVNEMDERPTTA